MNDSTKWLGVSIGLIVLEGILLYYLVAGITSLTFSHALAMVLCAVAFSFVYSLALELAGKEAEKEVCEEFLKTHPVDNE